MMSFDFEFGEFVPCLVNDDTPLEVMACDRMRRELQKLKSAHQQTPGPSLFSSRRSSTDVSGFTWTSDELRQLSQFNPPSTNKPTSYPPSFEEGGIESACEGYGFADSEDTCLRTDSSMPVLTLDPRTDEEPRYIPFNDALIDFSSLYSVRDAFDATLKPLPSLKPNKPATSSVPNAPSVDDHTPQPQPTLEAVDLNTIDLTTACEAPRLLESDPSQRKRVKLDHGSSFTAIAENIPPVLQPQSTPLPKHHKRNQAQTATNSKTSQTEREIAIARSKGFIPIIVDGTQKYQCSACKRPASFSTINSHLRDRCPVLRRYLYFCEVCGLQASREDVSKRHRQNHPDACVAQQRLNIKSGLKSHVSQQLLTAQTKGTPYKRC